MTHEEANRILDQHKEGSNAYSMLAINRALYITGDIISEPTVMACEVGNYTRLEGVRLEQND